MNPSHESADRGRFIGAADRWEACGFTLVELLVVIALLAVGAMVLLPALARTSAVSPATRCLNNLKQLQQACAMFAADNDGRLVANGGGFTFNSTRWAGGWQDWNLQSANTNVLYLLNAALGAYTAGHLSLYKCPADRLPALNGPRLRSYSMNAFVGGTSEWEVYGHVDYRTFLKEADFTLPGAANTFVLVDEHPDSINDEALQIRMTPRTLWPGPTSWEDVPASYHNGAGAFSFADGHVELRLWRDSNTKAPVVKTVPCGATGKTSLNDNRWFSAHATAPR